MLMKYDDDDDDDDDDDERVGDSKMRQEPQVLSKSCLPVPGSLL